MINPLIASAASAATASTIFVVAPMIHTTSDPPDEAIIGDSLVHRSADELAAINPNWHIDGVGGRPVVDLHANIRTLLGTQGNPQKAVLALGTNARPDWTKSDYREAAQMFAPGTQVYFVIPYTRCRNSPLAPVLDTYKDWMIQVSSENLDWHFIPWRWYVEQGFATLSDCLHANPDDGSEQVHAQMIEDYTTLKDNS